MLKPQIVSIADGVHNANLEVSRARILQGGSWKKQRTIILYPSADTIPMKVVLPFMSMATPPNQAVHRMALLGMEIGDAYSSAIEAILANGELAGWEYLMTIEADNLIRPDTLVRLIESMEKYPQYACIGALYWTKGFGGVPQIWGDKSDPVMNFRPQPPRLPHENDGMVECWGTGMGANLWRLPMFKDQRLRRPWFKTINGVNGPGIGTQDLYFWGDAQKFGYRCAVDCKITCGHYDLEGKFGPPDTVW